MILNFKPKAAKQADAHVVDGKLILSLPEALSPVVWQMDLAHAKASALEVSEGEGESAGTYRLILKTPKGETVNVAGFATKDEAVEALRAVSAALANAHGQIRAAGASGDVGSAAANDASSSQNLSPAARKQRRSRWMRGVLALVILFILFWIWASVMPRVAMLGPSTPSGGVGMTGNMGAGQMQSGQPMSADEFLRGQ